MLVLLSIFDDFTKYIWYFSLQAKYDVTIIFIAFLSYVKNCFTKNVKSMQMDGGGEFRPFQRVP